MQPYRRRAAPKRLATPYRERKTGCRLLPGTVISYLHVYSERLLTGAAPFVSSKMATFANILYDESFKVVLSEPSNRRLLIKLIEFFLPGKTIRSLTLNDKEQHGLILSDKNVNFDLYCTTMTTELDIIARREFARKEGRAEGLS